MKPRTLLSFIAAFATVSCTPACAGYAAETPVPSDTVQDRVPRLYVANQDAASVTVIDTRTHEVIETVDLTALGYSPTAKPHHIAVEPDGSFWYVSLIADGYVLKFDRNNQLVGRTPYETPGMLAIHPSRDLLYVGRSMAAVNPPQRIGEIRRSVMEIDEVDVFFARPHALTVDATRDVVYTGSLAGNDIASVSIESQEAQLSRLPGNPHVYVQFALSPDATRLVATGHLTSKFLVFDVTVPAAPRLVETLDVGSMPWHPVFTPDGRFVYFGNQGANTVTVVATDTWTVAHVIEGEGLAEPHGIAVTPDGRYVYVSNRNLSGAYRTPGADPRAGNVVVIDTRTNRIERVIPAGRYAAGLGIG